jgi:hypothetical protein
LPLLALCCAGAAALLALAVPLLNRRDKSPWTRYIRIGEVLAIGGAAVLLVLWARDPQAWRLAKEYHRFAPFISMGFMLLAALEAIGYGPQLRRHVAQFWPQRARTMQVIAGAFAVVLVVQSITWLHISDGLRTAVARSPWTCVSLAPIASIKGTALDDWSAAYLALLQQGRTPQQLILADDGCGRTDFAAGVRLNPDLDPSVVRRWDDGWFDLDSVRQRLTGEQTVARCWFELTIGWHQTETEGSFWWRWSDGRDAQIRVMADHDETVVLGGQVQTARQPNRVDVMVNGQRLTSVDLATTDLQTLNPLTLPLKAGMNTIRLVSQNPSIPSTVDGRPLAISLANLTMAVAGSNATCDFHP